VPVRILCTGDIHIGRQASKTREWYRTASAWTALVELAIEERVDVLAISGDVIDKAVSSYESIGPLTAGLSKLGNAGIETVAVAGNHDYEVLPRVASYSGMERFHLVGKGGAWERHIVVRDDRPILVVDGWSFPAEHVHANPMDSYMVQSASDVPVLGLLHADLDAPASHYAPASLSQFAGRRVDFWLLGHIHIPRLRSAPGPEPVLYPGSPWAMDPGESGAHGVWIVELEAGKLAAPRHLPISPVRYDKIAIDLAKVETEADFQSTVVSALQDKALSVIAEHGGDSLRELILRIHYTGATPAHQAIGAWAGRVQLEMSPFQVGTLEVVIEAWTSDVRPEVDLQDLARGTSPLAEAARLVLALEQPNPNPVYEDLIARTTARLGAVAGDQAFGSLDRDAPTRDTARALLVQRGMTLISALIETKG